jgi:hypothetical protein
MQERPLRAAGAYVIKGLTGYEGPAAQPSPPIGLRLGRTMTWMSRFGSGKGLSG